MTGTMNFLNLKPEELKNPIYRVMPCNRFLQILKTRTNGLVRPRMWNDPFENFILNGIAVAPDGTKARFGFRDNLYGQCWSLYREKDAMWRIYSPKKRGVKLQTTIERLFNSLYSKVDRFNDISCFIGKVRYIAKDRIAEALNNINPLDPSGAGIAQTLLIKRMAFSPEREVRLVYLNHDKSFSDDVFVYTIDPNVVFDRAVLDPRMLDAEVQQWKQKFKSAGFTKGIIQSGLYKPPKNVFINVP